MHDPFPIPAPSFLSRLVRPYCNTLGLTTLPLHIHEALLFSIFYTLTSLIFAPALSRRLFPKYYNSFNPRTKLNWDIHVVSLLQSVIVCTVALYVMWKDEERRGMGWEERVWGYTGAGAMVQAMAAGYFLWDLGICVVHFRIFGVGLLAHAVAALVVFSFGFRPFVNFYGPTFILYELSSPFLNFHWFFDKVNMTGSRAQWYNGILLLGSFFCCRLLWGTYQSIRVYQDVWAGLHFDVAGRLAQQREDGVFEPLGEEDEVMRYAGHYPLPTWLATTYLVSNIVLNTLNFYWFGKMIETVSKRFRDPKKKQEKEKSEGVLVEGLVDAETIGELVELADAKVDGVVKADGTSSGISVSHTTRKRKT